MTLATDPSPEQLNRRLATLSPAQRALLAEKLAAREAEAAVLRVRSWRSELPPDANTFPTSSGQQRLWILDQILPDRTAYSITRLLRLTGGFDFEALRRGLDLMRARHESLRTRIVMSSDKTSPAPNQVIDPPAPIDLPLIDLQSLERDAREAKAREAAEAEACLPIDLEHGPVFRALVIKLTQDEHWLVMNIHHSVSDGWSERVFCSELSVAYNAFASGNVPELPVLPLSYADYALSQREWIGSEAYQEQLAYWKRTLAGITTLDLPSDRSGVADESLKGTSLTVEVPPTLTKAVKEFSRRQGATPYMTMLSAFLVLLYRYSGQEDLAVGTPTAGRNQSELEGLVGFFVSTVVVRNDLSGQPTFSEFLSRVRDNVLNAYSHQDTPFEKLVEDLAPPRVAGRSPLIDVLVNMSPRAGSSLRFDGVTAVDLPLPPAAKVALTLEIQVRETDIELQLIGQADKFSEARIGTLLAQCLLLLEQVTASPGRRISEYSLVTPEARLLLPDPTVPIPAQPQGFVTALVLGWAERAPEHTAVSTADKDWTYSELAARATTLAKGLSDLGAGRGTVVAIVAPRSFGLIAGMLGVLMSGGVLLTIEPDLPAGRKRVMLRESGARIVVLVDQPAGAENELKGDVPLAVLRADRDLGSIEGLSQPVAGPWSPPEIQALDPAYVFFTSGSTGRPKGILGSHQALSHFLNWQRQAFQFDEHDRVSQLIGLSWDPILQDVFLPLTSGATVCVPSERDLLDPLGWLQRARVTAVHTTPTIMTSWLSAHGQPLSLEALRWVFIIGEPLTDRLIDRWRRTVQSPAELLNFYGPTETTIIITSHQVGVDAEPGVQPIGRCISNSQALILNAAGNLCGIGEIGEIALRTPYGTLGYVNLPDENLLRFRPNPFRSDDTDIVYFTGDRGRYREDGVMEIIGRIDDQVKVRGTRMEPGEVAAALVCHPGVRHTAVIALKDEVGQYSLVAYVALNAGCQPEVHALRSFVGERLPQAYIPSAFVFVDELPMLPNGKVDRKALAALPIPAAAAEASAPPGDLLEVRLAHIWERVLGVSRVEADDNFFDLGGYSLMAVRLFIEVEESFGVRLPLATLFQAPTVRTLAAILRHEGWTPPWQSLVAIRTGGNRLPLFLVHGIGGNVVGFRHLAKQLDSDRPIFGLQSRGLHGSAEVCFTVEEMAQHYVREMLSVQPSGPFHICGMSFGGRVAFEVAQQLTRGGHEVGVLALLDAGPQGYSDMLPLADRALEKAGWWKRRIEGHLHELRNANDFAAYAGRKIKTARRKLRSRVWQSAYEKYALKGEPLPAELVSVTEANFLASRRYAPKPYDGKVTLFMAADNLPSEARALRDAWSVVSLGGVNTHEVPGNHVTLIEPPHVSILAAKLQACLLEFESALTSRRPLATDDPK